MLMNHVCVNDHMVMSHVDHIRMIFLWWAKISRVDVRIRDEDKTYRIKIREIECTADDDVSKNVSRLDID